MTTLLTFACAQRDVYLALASVEGLESKSSSYRTSFVHLPHGCYRWESRTCETDLEFAVMTVKGQSFMIHQIRKMIGEFVSIGHYCHANYPWQVHCVKYGN